MIAKPTLLSHTHFQAPRANAKSKACQRVCLSERTGNIAAKLIDNELNKQKSPVPNKRSYAIGVLVVYQAFQLASRFVTGDTDAATKSPTAHTADRCASA
jgi:hypothetical protein